MKNKHRNQFSTIMIVGIFFLTISCSKDNNVNPYQSRGINTAVYNSEKTYATVSDFDGNVYKTITIGTQTWMAENLRTTHYQNGEAIPEVTENTLWGKLATGVFCNYNNTSNNDTITTFGRLYNYYTLIDNRNISVKGWHVPTIAEWDTLIVYLGIDSVTCYKLKEKGAYHWTNNSEATNESGFTALPAGYRSHTGILMNIGYQGGWWSSTEFNTIFAWGRGINCDDNTVLRSFGSKLGGYSVRLVKD